MVKIYHLLFFALFFFAFCSCEETEEEKKKKSIELMTTQTMGFAYLEELKLKEAENEFLKYTKLAPDDKLGYANLGLVYLRMGKYQEAEKKLLKAKSIDSQDADVRLLLATVYQMNGEREKAISELEEALKISPDHVKILYDLSELYSAEPDEQSQLKRKKYLTHLVEQAPGNIVPKLNLTELYISGGESDKAIEQLEIIKKQFPEFPKESIEYYNLSLSLLRETDHESALIQFTIFHNFVKVSLPYQEGIKNLKGPGGSVIGVPLINYSEQSFPHDLENTAVLDLIRFTDATKSAGIELDPSFDKANIDYRNLTHVEAADYDGDGDIDIYAGRFDSASSTYQHYLFNNSRGRFKEVSEEVGLNHTGKESSAVFVDFDNDGYLDLYIVKEDGDILYRNVEDGLFQDITNDAEIGSETGALKALFLDLDHDGDLDLFESRPNLNLVFRNNGDGTFVEQAEKMGLAGSDGIMGKDAAFGDFDDDGDIDLIVVNENTTTNLYSNQRQGRFKDIGQNSGFTKDLGSRSVAVGDHNNDGFLDLFIPSVGEDHNAFYNNLGNGNFESVNNTEELSAALSSTDVYDSQYFDFDNDGFLDIVFVGESKRDDGRGVYLFHNDGRGKFHDRSDLLPDQPKSGKQITLFDYNEDGDLDLLIAGLNGAVFLLRNDGGNANHYVNMKLVGLRTGSAKNNYYGIGAKVEMRAGDLYQSAVVTDPNIYFGLGTREKADVMRITWTNGVPQNILLPDTDQSLVETQVLKGSCPFLYTWNGDKYVFVKDITWRSALGMPLGIMGGNTMYSFADASDDYIKIPGEMLRAEDGKFSIQVTSELWETIYMDKIQLVAVDHPDSVDIFVPEQFSPPPFPGLKIFQVSHKQKPVSARDGQGNNLLSFILEKDDKYISNFNPGKYQGITEMHELILDPGESAQNKNLFIFLNGWIFPTDASINAALSQSDQLNPMPPTLEVINKKGEWEKADVNLSFPMGKDKMVIADLSGIFLSNDHRIRIRTNMEIYWDEIFFSDCRPNAPVVSTVMNPVKADLHYRGFSRSYRKGGRYGPHWFDYSDVDKNVKWRDLTGNYTRYGNVLPLLTESDNQYIISNAGDETSIQFNEEELPKLKEGWKRDFLIHSVGWVKDGDLNTAFGNTVAPLPYHGMSSYPPAEKDKYPSEIELQEYQKDYNTRVVTLDNYRNSIKNKNE